jgi:hypothetical protein
MASHEDVTGLLGIVAALEEGWHRLSLVLSSDPAAGPGAAPSQDRTLSYPRSQSRMRIRTKTEYG